MRPRQVEEFLSLEMTGAKLALNCIVFPGSLGLKEGKGREGIDADWKGLDGAKLGWACGLQVIKDLELEFRG